MVCNRSLYCWKNGPCASDQARKQIWEDNMKFRKNLRDVNQSDHYWSFQISENLCLCIEGEDLFHGRQLVRKYKSGSLQKLHEIDCASITHDCNGLKHRNCYVHCPRQSNAERTTTPLPKHSLPKRDMATSTGHSLAPVPLTKKCHEGSSQYCHRYKNTLSDSCLKPTLKIKFPSQLNLSGNKNVTTLKKNLMHSSCDNILTTTDDKSSNPVNINTRKSGLNMEEKEETDLGVSYTKKEDTTLETSKKRPKQIDHSQRYTPVSRTTRKMLQPGRKLPFVTFGCNNNNNDIGSKRTHNVLASAMEVYPNALSAKQNKRNMILKNLQSEKELQKKCFSTSGNKGNINHSSLWSIECTEKEKSQKNKKPAYLLPLMRNQPKQMGKQTQNTDSYSFKAHRKPQIYFY